MASACMIECGMCLAKDWQCYGECKQFRTCDEYGNVSCYRMTMLTGVLLGFLHLCMSLLKCGDVSCDRMAFLVCCMSLMKICEFVCLNVGMCLDTEW